MIIISRELFLNRHRQDQTNRHGWNLAIVAIFELWPETFAALTRRSCRSPEVGRTDLGQPWPWQARTLDLCRGRTEHAARDFDLVPDRHLER